VVINGRIQELRAQSLYFIATPRTNAFIIFCYLN